jgi:F-type H+-transporting ATPase subunit c
MMKKSIIATLAFGALLYAGLAWASEQAAVAAVNQTAQAFSINYFSWTVVIAMIGLSIVATICGIAQGGVIKSAIENIARQPETAGKIQMIMMIGLAFIESLVLYVLFVGIILLFVNPFSKYFVH